MKILGTVLLTFVFLAVCPAVHADITYNYANDYMYDSASGLYWSFGSVAAGSGSPSAPWSVASVGQLSQAETDLVQALGGQLSEPLSYSSTIYSQQISNFVGFFLNDAPGPAGSVLTNSGGIASNFGGIINGNFCPGCGPSSEPLFASVLYSYSRGSWALYFDSTAATKNWDYPSSCGTNSCPAFLVSTVSPVPLPATVWLMLSGLGGLGAMSRKQRAA